MIPSYLRIEIFTKRDCIVHLDAIGLFPGLLSFKGLHGEKFILDSKRNIIESKRNFALSESQVDFLLHFKRSLLFDFNLIFHLNISRLSLYNGQQTSPWNNEKTSYYSVDWSLDTNRDEIEIYSSCRIDTRSYFYLNVTCRLYLKEIQLNPIWMTK